jgi:Ca-activated chloride channel family protein
MPRLLSCRFALALVSGLILGLAQLDAQRSLFSSSIEMVPLTVTVTDGRGNYVNRLEGTDFSVFEDGVQQRLSFFASEQVAVDLALVLDASGSMHANMPVVQKAANGLLGSLGPHDRATAAVVRRTFRVLEPLTTDHAQVQGAIQTLTASGDTALFDGLYIVLKELARSRVRASEIRKQALVVLSDGLDTASRLGLDDVREMAGRVGVNIYAIVIPCPARQVLGQALDDRVLQAEYAMKSLARDSGGRSFLPKTLRELPGIYAQIGKELANQYELGYVPARPLGDRGFRRVTVRVENAVARTRSGYYADREPVARISAAERTPPGLLNVPPR